MAARRPLAFHSGALVAALALLSACVTLALAATLDRDAAATAAPARMLLPFPALLRPGDPPKPNEIRPPRDRPHTCFVASPNCDNRSCMLFAAAKAPRGTALSSCEGSRRATPHFHRLFVALP
jgi:hypothetical protein